jgi:hypothetical protein
MLKGGGPKSGVATMAMKRTAGIIWISILFVNLSSFAFSQKNEGGDSVEREIRKLEQERLNAYLQLDSSALDRITSDDYTSIYADGQIVTKAQEMQGLKSAPAGMLSSVTAKIDQLSVRHYQTTAFLVGKLVIKGKIAWSQKNITLNASFRYSATYVKSKDRWQVVACQFTKIDDSEKNEKPD